MARALAVLAITPILAACEAWVPREFPAAVDVSGALTSEQREALVAACDRWNRMVGEPVLEPVESNGRRIQRGRIHVHGGRPRDGEIATATANAWSCKVASGDAADVDTFVHELGHCLGLEHDEVTGESIMAEYAAPGQRILPDHVEYVHALMRPPLGLEYITNEESE